jgi:hypothetical protein
MSTEVWPVQYCPEHVEPEVLAYRGAPDETFWILHCHALRFAELRAREGFEFLEGAYASASFQILCKGVPVLHVERQPPLLLIRVALGAERRATGDGRLRSSPCRPRCIGHWCR